MNNVIGEWKQVYHQRGKTLNIKFWEKVDIKSENECWEWRASRSKKGYGSFWLSLGNSNSKLIPAHRMAYALQYNLIIIPPDMCVLHHCDNPPCCNPNHLFLGTNNDNVQDKVRKGRMNPLKGEKNPCARLTEDDILSIRKSRANGETCVSIAKRYSMTSANISHIARGKGWKCVKEGA